MANFLQHEMKITTNDGKKKEKKTKSSCLKYALRDDEAVYWVGIGHYEAVNDAGSVEGLYILNKVETWTGVTDA